MVEQKNPTVAPVEKNEPAPPAADAGKQATPEPTEKMVPLAALQQERDVIRDLKAQVELLQSMNPYGNQAPPQRPIDHGFGVEQPPQNNQRAQMDQLWEQDPKRAMQAEISMALNWYDRTNASLDMQEEQVATKHTDFGNYRGQVRQYLRTLAPEHRTKPGVVEMAYYLAKGQKTDDLVNMSKEELIQRIKAGEDVQGFTQGAGAAPQPAPQAGRPTQDQINAARAMGQDVDEYMKHIVAGR